MVDRLFWALYLSLLIGGPLLLALNLLEVI